MMTDSLERIRHYKVFVIHYYAFLQKNKTF